MKRSYSMLLAGVFSIMMVGSGADLLAESSAGRASVSASVKIIVNVPVRTLLRVSAAGVEGRANLDAAAGNVLITREVLPALNDGTPATTVTTITAL